MSKKDLQKVEKWLRDTFYTDHVDHNQGLGCIFPDIILCDKYFTVDELVNAMYKNLSK